MIIVCRNCGTHSSGGDAFCGNCGAFLEWTGDQVTPHVSEEFVAQAEEEAAAPPRRSLFQRAVTASQNLVGGPARAGVLSGAPTTAPRPAAGPPGAAPRPPGPPGAPPRPGGAPPPPRPGGGPPPPPPPGGRPAPPPPPPPPGGAPPPPPPPPGGAAPPPPPPPPGAAPPPPPPPPGGAAPPPPPPPPPSPEQQVAALVAPVRKTEPVQPKPDEPVERVPQAARPKAPPVTRTSSERKLRPGDLICGACGEGNLPTRKFCGRCGESLATAEVVRTPWWRKLFRRRGPKVVKASKHGRKRSTFGVGDAFRRVYRVGRIVVGIAIILGGVIYAAYPPFRTMINSEITGVKQDVTKKVDTAFVPVHAAKVVASAQKKGHAGSLAVDEVLNTSWLAPAGTGQFPSLTLTFQHPETLERMIIHSGIANDYTGHGRPSQLVLIYSNQESESLDLQDTAKPQTVDISHALRVTSVRIEVASTYSGGRPPDVAISEIELFALP